jgi:O-methyltransferase
MANSPDNPHRAAYIDLLKRTITNYAFLGGDSSFEDFHCVTHYDLEQAKWKIDRVAQPLTLLTKGQLDLIEEIVVVLDELKVPGDFLEAGVWRGGAIILMRALLDAYRIDHRRVFAADSFSGIPQNRHAVNDPVDDWSDRWAASLEEVRQSVARLGFLDEKIVFVPGYFADSLGSLTNERFALIRLDSDSYDSVRTSLEYLYPLLSTGGFVIIDDWHLPGCRMAVEDFRARHAIGGEIQVSSGNAFWAKHQDFGSPQQR